jgi:two-component system response regulator FlrC
LFREDLFYRLNVFPVAIPSLRERPEDIVPIARSFVVEHGGRLGRTGVSLSSAAEMALLEHAWPGNVRELENVIQRALIMAPGKSISPEHLRLMPRPGAEVSTVAPSTQAMQIPVTPALQESDKRVDNMRDLERDHILKTLAEVGGSRKLTIERLGISERTLRYKLQQYRDEGFFKD